MKLPESVRLYLLGKAQGVMASRPPDVKINDDYVHRWMLLPKSNPVSKWFNVYIHLFQGDDEDGALHDHEPDNASLILQGNYKEHFHVKPLQTTWIDTPTGVKQRYIVRSVVRYEGDIAFRLAGTPHRITLFERWDGDGGKRPVITMFIQGPRRRRWGFSCVSGWKPWQEYINETNGYGDRSGKGCG